jgi:hypothetical protein
MVAPGMKPIEQAFASLFLSADARCARSSRSLRLGPDLPATWNSHCPVQPLRNSHGAYATIDPGIEAKGLIGEMQARLRIESRIRYGYRGVVQKLCPPLTNRIDPGLFLAAPRIISLPLDREERFPWLSSPTTVLR